MDFGSYIRWLRQQRHQSNDRYTIQQTAQRVGIGTTYLSRIERNDVSPPSEDVIRRLAADLGEDSDVLLALAGKLSSDLREAIIQRPILFAELIRNWGDLSDQELAKRVYKLRSKKW